MPGREGQQERRNRIARARKLKPTRAMAAEQECTIDLRLIELHGVSQIRVPLKEVDSIDFVKPAATSGPFSPCNARGLAGELLVCSMGASA